MSGHLSKIPAMSPLEPNGKSFMSKLRLALYVAFLVSLLVHLVLFNAALNAKWIRQMFREAPGKDFFTVEKVVPDDYKVYQPETEISIEDLLTFTKSEQEDYEKNRAEDDINKLIEEKDFIPFDASEQEIYDSVKKMFESETVERTEKTPDIKDPGKSVAQEIIAIEQSILSEKIEPSGWAISSSTPRGKATTDFVYIDDSATGGGSGGTGNSGGIPTGTGFNFNDDFVVDNKKIPGIIKPPIDKNLSEIEASEIKDTLAEDISQIRKYQALDDLLEVSLYTYHEPGDPTGFFEVIIKPRADRKDFEIIPKDVIFIVDSSASILDSKLAEYVKGVDYAVSRLNENDRFNIVEFKNYVKTFREGLLPATPANIAEGRRFLSGLRSVGATDVFKAFSPFVKERPAKDRPYIMFLVTDGRPTTGVVDTREIINNLTKTNQNKTAIYAFAGGGKINEYLLDLLSYRNKGASRFERKLNQVADSLKKFSDELRHPVLINLQYNFASLNATEIYPKILPDLFLGNRLVLSGRYGSEGLFSVQILGEVNGKTKEYIFQQELTGEDSGSRDVARLWAFHKIYYLIGRIVDEGENPELLNEIKSLSDKFNIQTPYF